jgi:hypothetical protein
LLKEVKYLGISFDQKLLRNEHVNNGANKTFTRISELYLSSITTATFSHVITLQLYMSYIRRSLDIYAEIYNLKTPDDIKQMLEDDWKISQNNKR